MDWTLATTRNRGELLVLLASMFVTLGIASGAVVSELPRHVHRTLLRILRPAESAVRRLIVVAARGVEVTVPAQVDAPFSAIPRGTGTRVPVFGLFDPRRAVGPVGKTVPGYGPSVRPLDGSAAPIPQVPEISPDDLLDAKRLVARGQALRAALDDLPGQALRLARAMARQRAAEARPVKLPMRPGRPPGYRARQTHPIHEVLAECQRLALLSLVPDTS